MQDSSTDYFDAEDTLRARTFTHKVFENRDAAWLVGLVRHDETIDMVFNNPEFPALTRISDLTYDADGLLDTVTRTQSDPEDESQETTIVRYDDVYRNVRTTTTAGTWRAAGGGQESGVRATTLEYDPKGVHVARIYRHLGTDDCSIAKAGTAECQTTEVKYDPRDGSLIARLDANGIGERWAYDAFGRVVRHETPADVVTTTYSSTSEETLTPFPVRPRMKVETTSQNSGAASAVYVDALERVVRTSGTGIGGQLVFSETEYLFADLTLRSSAPRMS